MELGQRKMSQRRRNSLGSMENVEHGPFQFSGISWIDQPANSAVQHSLSAPIQGAGQHGYAACHRLEVDNSEAFPAPRHHEGIGQAIVIDLFLLHDETGEN